MILRRASMIMAAVALLLALSGQSVLAGGSTPSPAASSAPATPNCLGNDLSGFAQNARPLGQNVVTNFTSGGFGSEILAHLQGIPAVSNCADNGFPSRTPPVP